MGHHRSRRPTSSDSGYDTTSEGLISPLRDETKSRVSKASSRQSPSQKDRKTSVDEQSASLLSIATRTDLNPSIGTELSNVQLANLNLQQLDELALLVSDRGVVFFRDQDLTAKEQIHIFEHYGATAGKHIVEKNQDALKIKSRKDDHGEKFTYASGRRNEWASDRSFEVMPPGYSMLKAGEAGSETVWVSQYGLYDGLSKHMKAFLDGLESVHTSRGQYESIINLRGMPSNRAPVESRHPAVRTHPVTGLKALNVTPGCVTGFEELTRKESDKLLELLEYHINSADEHTVRFKWEAGSVAIWDNRCTARKSISASSSKSFKNFETASVGEKPYFNRHSESRDERVRRQAKEEAEELRRLEEVKKRYNNTPLRRILRAQACGGESSLNTNKPLQDSPGSKTSFVPETVTPKKSSEDATSSELVPNSNELAQHAKQLAKDIDSEDAVIVVEKKLGSESGNSIRVEVNSKGSPLRRIIQRQVSGNIGARGGILR
ncbi:Nn.00g053470.m01.CDS01 [Neocucurbitaria sp. VM-36]